MILTKSSLATVVLLASSVGASHAESQASFRLITLDPGHFHAALVQKKMVTSVSPEVHIYAPDGPDLDLHLERVSSFNSRAENPTNWDLKIHTGSPKNPATSSSSPVTTATKPATFSNPSRPG